MYALCATIYHLICEQAPPDAWSLYEKDEKIIPPHEFEPSMPKRIESTLLNGLNPDIKTRIKDMEELYSYLYEDKRPINWRIIKQGITFFMSGALILLIVTAVYNYISTGIEDKSQNEIVADVRGNSEPLQAAQSDISKEFDTAKSYVESNGLQYLKDNLMATEDNSDGLTVTSTDYSLTDIAIPEEVNGKKITAISGIGTNVTSLVIPDTVTMIDNDAFKNCVYLETLYIPASVEAIGTNAFENCISLSDIIISKDNQKFYVSDGKIYDIAGTIYN